MTTIHVCKIDDVIVFSSVSEEECRSKCTQLKRNQAQKNLLTRQSVPNSLLGKNIENILLRTLNISNRDVDEEVSKITNITCSDHVV
jgi:hypothetical protein